jgi:cell division protein FtsN
MRRVRPDVSHRIRRQPSIFSVRWFRIALGAGVALAIALFVGPSVAGWFGGDLPKSLFLLAPWAGSDKTAQARPSEPTMARPSLSSPGALPPDAGKAPSAPASKTPTTVPADTQPAASPRATASAAPTPSAPAAAPKAAAPREPTNPASPPAATTNAPATSELAAPPSVYWVQVGAFLDHKNADRLVERLKGDGLSATTTSFEQSRVMYRVLLVGSGAGRPSDDTVEKVRGLGHPIESTADGPAVTGLVPLRKAVETSHALRQQGFPVRLKQEVSSSTYRVVRVGSFPTVAEADATLASLTAKGLEGVVVRER